MIGRLLKAAGAAAPAVLVMAVALAPVPAQAATAQTGITGAPQADQLVSLSCPSQSFCMAVGGYSSPQLTGRNFTEAWHGTGAWQLLPSVVPDLEGVSCVSATFCMAVGFAGAQAWNGTSWKPVPKSPAADAVSCTSSTFCVAVGGGGVASEWNGSTWRSQTITFTCPPFHGGCADILTRVSCDSATFCMTIGTIGSDTPQSISATWSGAAWTQQAVPTVQTHSANLAGLSCTSSTSCLAVGETRFEPAATAMTWDGSVWQSQTAPDLTGPDQVSCTSGTACLAASGNGVEEWTGSAWEPFAAPAGPGETTITITGLACTGAPLTGCMLTGYYGTSFLGTLTLAEQWSGSNWQVLHTSSPGAIDGLLGVSCTSATFCMAVGTTIGSGDVQQATAEQWNGHSWAGPAPLSPGVELNYLAGVSCQTRFSCIAVGSFDNALGNRQTLAESWDGHSWTQLNTLDPGTNDQFSAVSCPTAHECMAVGTQSVPNTVRTLAERWNGSTWQVTPSPDPGSTHPVQKFNYLSGISCTAPSFCIATGDYNKRLPSGQRPLAISWNGRSWQTLRTAGQNGELAAVSCLTKTRCLAVGADVNGLGQLTGPMAQQWNGSTWVQRSPAGIATGTGAHLSGVSCAATTFCLAVGSFTAEGGQVHTLAQTWNGSSWRNIASPNPSPALSIWYAASCTSHKSCIAVGQALQHPLDALWNGARWLS